MAEYYIYPCNAVYFDIESHFSRKNTIVWRAVAGIKTGDTVFVYVGKTLREIRYKCRVVSEEVSQSILQENAYAIPKGKIADRCSYVIMEKIKEYEAGTFPLTELKANGMGQFMVPMRADNGLKDYLLKKDEITGGEE